MIQGAEAVIRKEKDLVVKERVLKGYRHPKLDKQLRQFRTRREAKILEKLTEIGFPSPVLHKGCDKEMRLDMELIEGDMLKEVFGLEFIRQIGELIARLHKNNIIHGDLTTSNMILKEDNVYLIDFGLSLFSQKVEDKAVDLHLLDRALESKHHSTYPENIKLVIEAYRESYVDADSVLERYELVKKRGRNKAK